MDDDKKYPSKEGMGPLCARPPPPTFCTPRRILGIHAWSHVTSRTMPAGGCNLLLRPQPVYQADTVVAAVRAYPARLGGFLRLR